MTGSQIVLLLIAGAGIALISSVVTALVQHRLSPRADRFGRGWDEVEQEPAPEEVQLRTARDTLATQQDAFRSMMLSARREYLQLADSVMDTHAVRDVYKRSQIVLLQLEELEGDFKRTLELKQRAEEELLQLATEAEKETPLPETPAAGQPRVSAPESRQQEVAGEVSNNR